MKKTRVIAAGLAVLLSASSLFGCSAYPTESPYSSDNRHTEAFQLLSDDTRAAVQPLSAQGDAGGIKEDFDGLNGEYAGGNGITVESSDGCAFIGSALPDGRHALKASVSSSSQGGKISFSTDGTWESRNISCKLYAVDGGASVDFPCIGENALLTLDSGKLLTSDGLEIYTFPSQKWTEISVSFDVAAQSYSVIINGYGYLSGVPLPESFDGASTVSLRFNSAAADYSVYADELSLCSSLFPDGYRGELDKAVESSVYILAPGMHSNLKGDAKFSSSAEVVGRGESTLKVTDFSSTLSLGLSKSGLPFVNGDTSLVDYDAVRIRYYAPVNSHRTVLMIFDCGNVYTDGTTVYYDGSWEKGSDGYYTCPEYPGVKASEPEGGKWGYFNKYVTFDGEGWCTLTLELDSFATNRTCSWEHIYEVSIRGSGWKIADYNATANVSGEQFVCYLESIELIRYE